jgi:hypothetical protein
MRTFIARHPLAFLASVLGGVVATAGLGSVAIGAGAAVIPLLYVELGLYLILPFAIVFGVPEREGGATAVALGAALPLLTFFAWLQHRIAGDPAVGFGLSALGATIVLWAAYWLAPRDEPASRRVKAATPRRAVILRPAPERVA